MNTKGVGIGNDAHECFSLPTTLKNTWRHVVPPTAPSAEKVNQISFQENAPTTKTIKFKSQKLAVMYVQLILPSGFVCVCAA